MRTLENLEKCSSSALLVPQETSPRLGRRPTPIVKQLWKHAKVLGRREGDWERDEVNGKKFPVCPNSGGGEGEKYRQKSCSTMRKMQLADKRARSHKLALLATVNYFLAQMWLSLSLVEKKLI